MIFRTLKLALSPSNAQKEKLDILDEIVFDVRKKYLDLFKKTDFIGKPSELADSFIKEDEKLERNGKEFVEAIIISINIEKSKKVKKPKNAIPAYPSDISNSHILIKGVGKVKYVNSIEEHLVSSIFSAVVSKRNNGRFYLYLNVSINEKYRHDLSYERAIGLDYSSTHFLVDDKGKRYDLPKFYRSEIKKIAKKQKLLTNLKKGSNKYLEVSKEIRMMYLKTHNKRMDYLHKLSTEIAEKYDYVGIESLNMVNISRLYNLGTATMDNSFSKFVALLEYKLSDRGKKLIRVSKWFPSSKKCNCCGYINSDLDLKTRNWTCPICNSQLDRDQNSAINIKEEAVRIAKVGGRSTCNLSTQSRKTRHGSF